LEQGEKTACERIRNERRKKINKGMKNEIKN